MRIKKPHAANSPAAANKTQAAYTSWTGSSCEARKVATSASIEMETTTTTKNRDRKRRTRVGPLMCASRITSSSVMVCAICRATTAAASSPMASITPCAASRSNPPTMASQPDLPAIKINPKAAQAKSPAIQAWMMEKRRLIVFMLWVVKSGNIKLLWSFGSLQESEPEETQ